MPSLRRAASSPSVRSSPYRSYSSSFAGAQARGHGHRRSSGSETSTRRVLADIDWWTVTDGQCEQPGADLESEERSLAELFVAADSFPDVLHVDTGADPLTRFGGTDESSAVPTVEFAALTIAPRTPKRRSRRAQQSPFSSGESTPEPSTPRFEGLRLGLSDMDLGAVLFEDHALLSPLGLDNLFAPCPKALVRSQTFADYATLQDEFANYGTDSPIVPLLALPALVN